LGSKIAARPLVLATSSAAFSLLAMFCSSASAAEQYQTNIGPTPKSGVGSNLAQGRGDVTATLNGDRFTIRGTFGGLTSPATQGQLRLGLVMGGAGPVISPLSATQANSGEISGAVTLTPEQVQALKVGRLYVLLSSQSAPNGNLWGWFQPKHVTVPENTPQTGSWYIPNFLQDN
jgi:hypothetical protein